MITGARDSKGVGLLSPFTAARRQVKVGSRGALADFGAAFAAALGGVPGASANDAVHLVGECVQALARAASRVVHLVLPAILETIAAISNIGHSTDSHL